jgi:hypothetical protein
MFRPGEEVIYLFRSEGGFVDRLEARVLDVESCARRRGRVLIEVPLAGGGHQLRLVAPDDLEHGS